MTLLNEENLVSIMERIPLLDARYRELTGMSLYEIACYAVGCQPMPASERAAIRVASVPVTAGGGLIGNFAEIVADIVREFAGVCAWRTEATDVAGFQEAVLAGADIVFCADDISCIAYNVRTGAISDNGYATGYAFGALLELVSGGIADNPLILGGGKVGVGAYRFLTRKGCDVRWHDINPTVSPELPRDKQCPDWRQHEWHYIVDATTAPTFIDAPHLASESFITAPGIPFGLTQAAVDKARSVIHDELESGIVTMLCEVMSSW